MTVPTFATAASTAAVRNLTPHHHSGSGPAKSDEQNQVVSWRSRAGWEEETVDPGEGTLLHDALPELAGKHYQPSDELQM